MEKFTIEIKETLSRRIEMEAHTMEEAYSIVREMYRNEEIVLDAGDYQDTDFIEIKE